MLFYFLINGFNYDAKTMVNFASPLSYDIDKIFTFVSDIDRYLFFFYKILQVVFIYEMVKSFRKFSRTLYDNRYAWINISNINAATGL
jgi:hypothetical protein